MKVLIDDSLPETVEDFRLDHEGFNGMKAWCRIRVYRPSKKSIAIVATQPYDVEDSGVTPMNAAEIVFAAAWKILREPWPSIFICHFAGEVREDAVRKEQWTLTIFPSRVDGPRLSEATDAGAFISLDGTGTVLESRFHLSNLTGFVQPDWKPLTRRQMEHLLGAKMPSKRFPVVVEPATIENSPTLRWMTEQFPDE